MRKYSGGLGASVSIQFRSTRLSLAESRNLSRTNICNHEAGKIHAIWRVKIVAIVSGYPCLNTQGLIQKKSAHRLWESFLTNKIAKQWWPNIIIKESKQNLHFFVIFFLLCSHYVADLLKKLKLCLMVVSVLLKNKFGHAQIRVPKISIPMSKTACINLCILFNIWQWNV